MRFFQHVEPVFLLVWCPHRAASSRELLLKLVGILICILAPQAQYKVRNIHSLTGGVFAWPSVRVSNNFHPNDWNGPNSNSQVQSFVLPMLTFESSQAPATCELTMAKSVRLRQGNLVTNKWIVRGMRVAGFRWSCHLRSEGKLGEAGFTCV